MQLPWEVASKGAIRRPAGRHAAAMFRSFSSVEQIRGWEGKSLHKLDCRPVSLLYRRFIGTPYEKLGVIGLNSAPQGCFIASQSASKDENLGEHPRTRLVGSFGLVRVQIGG